MKPTLLTIVLGAFFCFGCSLAGSNGRSNSVRLSDVERHRLYSAALAANDSPLESDTFKQVCRQIGIYDANGRPNDQYMAFVSRHVDWSMKSESDQFRREIDSKEKARDYIKRYLSQ